MRQSVKILFSCEDFPRIALLPGSIVLVLEKLSNRFGCAYAALCLCGESPFAVWSSGFGVRSSEFGDGAAVFQPFGFLTQKWYGAKSTFYVIAKSKICPNVVRPTTFSNECLSSPASVGLGFRSNTERRRNRFIKSRVLKPILLVNRTLGGVSS